MGSFRNPFILTILFLCSFSSKFVFGEIVTFLNFPNPEQGHGGNVTVFYIHDWNMNSVKGGIDFKNSLFRTRQDLSMVVVADWTRFSRSPQFYALAHRLTPILAQEVLQEMQELIEIDGVEPSSIECIGHGLGAHVCGQTGRSWNSIAENRGTLGKIIGLDPTGPYFKTHPSDQLAKTDATNVEVWNTDDRYGLYDSIGHSNIYPISGKHVKACKELNPLKRHQCLHDAVIPIYITKSHENGSDSSMPETNRDKIYMSILTLDVSPSMQNFGRIQNMIAASKRFIKSLPSDYSLGIVTFGGEAFVAVGPTNISESDFSRQRLTSNLPTTDTQIANTSIGAGILKALEVIESYSLTTSRGCPDIILVTDGEENRAPLLRDVQPYLTNICTKIHTIALGDDADEGLEGISELTRGQTYFASDVNSLDKLTQSLVASSSSQFAPKAKSIMLPPKPILLDVPVSFVFDEGMGKDTVIAISTPNPAEVQAELTAPDGIIYGVTNYTVDMDLHQLLFKLLQVQAGNWSIKLNKVDDLMPVNNVRRRRQADEIDVPRTQRPEQVGTVFVTTHANSESEETIRLDATLSKRIVTFGGDPVVLEASLYKGDNAIVGAKVEGELSTSSGSKVIFQLLDDGTGADAVKDDGIYSGFIRNDLIEPFKRYDVDVRATSAEDGTTKILSGKGDPFKLNDADMSPVPYAFERYASAGSFRVAPSGIGARSSPVQDLSANICDIEKRWCVLTWTSTGYDDSNNGTAEDDALQLRIFNTFNISDEIVVGHEQIVSGSLLRMPAGTPQNATVEIPVDLWDRTKSSDSFISLSFVLESYSNHNWTEVSNVANLPIMDYADPNYMSPHTKSNAWQIVVAALCIILLLVGVALYLVLRRRYASFNVKQTPYDKSYGSSATKAKM